jgi:NAD(P)-dependent dehydrogenase (short-subunit alcohol dehydrogenase family)
MDVQGKIIAVTGGAMGIGAAMCRAFARAGAAGVVVADMDGLTAGVIAEEIGGLAVAADVSVEHEVQQLVERAIHRYGRIDIFCSNAGIFGQRGGIDIPLSVWQRVWEVNVLAHLYAARAVVPHMLERGSGYLVQTVSAAGLLNQIDGAPYGVSKHAAIGLAEYLSIEYGGRGIRVSCVCPQGVQTRMLLGESGNADSFLKAGSVTPEHVAECVLRGIEAEKFLILPHPEVDEYYKRKGSDYDRWLRGMRRLRDQVLTATSPSQ